VPRGHVEGGYLTWNRTRHWRGQRADTGKGRAISVAVAQSSVLSLRNMLDDITAWGWAEAPRRRLVFATDVPKLGQPLPRALPPDVDAALVNAIARERHRRPVLAPAGRAGSSTRCGCCRPHPSGTCWPGTDRHISAHRVGSNACRYR
jgi:hypothetical protein